MCGLILRYHSMCAVFLRLAIFLIKFLYECDFPDFFHFPNRTLHAKMKSLNVRSMKFTTRNLQGIAITHAKGSLKQFQSHVPWLYIKDHMSTKV